MKIKDLFIEKYSLPLAIKEGFDSLDSGICYFYLNGNVKLCNRKMNSLYRLMCNENLQNFFDLQNQLDNYKGKRLGNIFEFPDGKAYQYSYRLITTSEKETYQEVVMSDVSQLHQRQKQLQSQMILLKQMQKQIEELSDNILELTVQKEILDLKNRLHDQMNMGVSAIKQLIKQDNISFDDDDAIIQLKRAISILKKEIEYPQDDLAQFIKDASVSKVDVIMTGEMVEDERYKSLLINLFRESCVNGANHGDASKLNIDIANDEKNYIITISNNGSQPEGKVVPKGGLLSLQKQFIKRNGKLEILDKPHFLLVGKLPIREGRL